MDKNFQNFFQISKLLTLHSPNFFFTLFACFTVNSSAVAPSFERRPFVVLILLVTAVVVEAGNNDRVFSPITDTTVENSDDFTLGFAFATQQKFFFNKT